jgi:phospholipid-binding lipoprotein MlaA
MRPSRFAFFLTALGVTLALGRPAGAAEPAVPAAETETDAATADQEWDPLEPVNRPIFRFNDGVDRWALEPVARGWDTIAADSVQDAVQNFFLNLRFPILFVNGILQADPHSAALSLSRFMANTTFGFLGFFDVASDWGLERQNEDFGQTLGRWGIPPGPFLMLPILGPSNPRDTVGLVADGYTAVVPLFVNTFIWLGSGVANSINTRALYLEQIERARAASLDYYGFVRNAYMQRRAALVRNETLPDSEGDALYDTDFLPEEGR